MGLRRYLHRLAQGSILALLRMQDFNGTRDFRDTRCGEDTGRLEYGLQSYTSISPLINAPDYLGPKNTMVNYEERRTYLVSLTHINFRFWD